MPGSGGGRRLADAWLPRGLGGQGQALDFACTSGMRSDVLPLVADDPNIVFERYEEHKRSHLDTAATCEAQGFAFMPMVLEASGGAWSPSARRVLDLVAKGLSSNWSDEGCPSSLRFAQRISIALHRENARAVLRRMEGRPSASAAPSGWAEAVLE